MHLINQVNFIAIFGRHILSIFQNITHIVNACMRGSVEFNKVNGLPTVDFNTSWASATRGRTNTAFTVDGFGKNSSNSGFADTTRACK